jgi:hypothetical protein
MHKFILLNMPKRCVAASSIAKMWYQGMNKIEHNASRQKFKNSVRKRDLKNYYDAGGVKTS